MPKRLSQEEYLRRATEMHNGKYDYSETIYTTMKHKIKIICPIHGLFEQLPQAHMLGQGCPKCGLDKFKANMIAKYGVDNPMKLKEVQEKSKKTCLEKYGTEYVMQSEEVKTKSRATAREKYGVDWIAQASEIQDKIKATTLDRYGVENVLCSNDVRKKIKSTNLEKYGTEQPLSSPAIRKKIKMTNVERYGGPAPMCSSEIVDKTRQTFQNQYGVDWATKDREIVDQIRETKSKHHTFRTSDSEDVMYDQLCDIFGTEHISRQYHSEKYPFACDFYIDILDLYIEYNGMWVHGHHWFDDDNEEDRQVLNLWKSRDTVYYKNAITVWTEKDVEKRKTAENNSLNYLTFWDNRLRDFELWIAMGCPMGKDWKKMYSWLPTRTIRENELWITNLTSSTNLSLITKKYHYELFYANEIQLWEKNPIFRTIPLQMWLYVNRYEYLGKLPHELSNLELLRGFTITGIHKGYSRFDTTAMKQICERYKIQSVYDPCAGWGERMLFCHFNDIRYMGVDVNERLKFGYDQMMSDLGISNATIIFKDSAKHIIEDAYDAVITCPPYHNIEIYSEYGAENLSENEFLKWWDRVVKQTVTANISYFCFQINQQWKMRLKDVVESNGFEFIESIELPKKTGHFHRKNGEIIKQEFEEMLIFKR